MAKSRGDQQRVESLQRLLASSWSAKLLAVRKVAQENDGRKTPGIDGVVSTTAEDRVSLLKDGLRLQGYQQARCRGLGAEGAGGPGLGAEGAGGPNQQARCRWILDADIKSFFDEIEHEVILSRVPVFREVIAGWLKAGVFTGEVYDPTEKGTPQGGVISPLLANIALHGLEDQFHEWSYVGGGRLRCETVETFTEPPKGYRKCKPANAKVSLRGPQRPRKTSRREPPKIYGPYPDGTWRTLRLVA